MPHPLKWRPTRASRRLILPDEDTGYSRQHRCRGHLPITVWTAGYVADIGYTDGYDTVLNPARLALPLLNAGLAPPQITHACQLGCGEG